MQAHKILIVDDHVFVRRGLVASLSLEPDLQVIGEAHSLAAALALCHELRPDIVVTDQRLGDDDGTDLVRQLRAAFPEMRCVVISSFETEEDIRRALDAGASSYVFKSAPADDLLQAVRAAGASERYLPPQVARILAQWASHAALSPRELDVLQKLAAGASNKEIGCALGISVHTVKQYVASLLQKLGVNDRSQAVLEALRRGLIRDASAR
jgi:two-component system NarL family response regulator